MLTNSTHPGVGGGHRWRRLRRAKQARDLMRRPPEADETRDAGADLGQRRQRAVGVVRVAGAPMVSDASAAWVLSMMALGLAALRGR